MEPLNPTLVVCLLSENATLPLRGSALAAGYDLFSAADCVVPAHGKWLVPTDVAVAVPEGHYGRIAPRSSVAWKHHVDVGAGVVDGDYRGPVGVVLFNHSAQDFEIKKGDRVAQLILEKCSMLPVVQVDSLVSTARGSGGFGSTGK